MSCFQVPFGQVVDKLAVFPACELVLADEEARQAYLPDRVLGIIGRCRPHEELPTGDVDEALADLIGPVEDDVDLFVLDSIDEGGASPGLTMVGRSRNSSDDLLSPGRAGDDFRLDTRPPDDTKCLVSLRRSDMGRPCTSSIA